MQNIQKISTDLFNKLRGRFDQITIGDESGTVTNTPDTARFFDFAYTEGKKELGKVSVSINEEGKLTVIFSKDFITAEDSFTQKNWYNFLKELRQFAKKRMLEFDVRDINKSNLTKRDYKFLAKQSGDENMNESKMYGTSRVSYQNVDEARIVIKHTENINQELNNRTQKIGSIYIESNDGERFKYPYKHLNGARAMARHVAEGGKPYDDFGKHITSLSEELSKLKKFTSYMGRSAVMAESLAEYTDVVKGRIKTVKKTIESLQKKKNYTEAFSSFESPVLEDVPSDVAENWIDQLTVRQFNEELKDVFPYIYKLVSEATKATELGPDDLVEAEEELSKCCDAPISDGDGDAEGRCTSCGEVVRVEEELGQLKDKYSKAKKTPEEIQIETAFEEMMGQFSDSVCEECGNPSYTTLPEEKQKGVDGKVCWKGYRRMGTKMKGGKRVDNCVKVSESEDLENFMTKIANSDDYDLLDQGLDGQHGPEIQKKLQSMYDDVAVDNGYHPDDDFEKIHDRMIDNITDDYGMGETDNVETDEKKQKTPLGEFILSYFDREQGAFPKGETAVLTMVEKDYGERFIEPAKAFIEQIQATYEEIQMRTQPQQMEVDTGFDRMRELAGLR